jgi:UDP-N-acetylmuramyl pentapeptide phosphotransferase/UDP-N-acetylglucosamine-1-phosphate transferase
MTISFATWQFVGGLGFVAAAALATAALIALLRPWLQRYSLARPNARSSHATPTPQGGGIAVVTVTLGLSMLLLAGGIVSADAGAQPWLVFAAAAFIALVGAIDDIRTIAVAPRLLLQAICVAAVIAALPADLHVIPSLPWWIERACLLLAGVWFVNLVNFMDGIDWMTVAEVVPLAGGLVLIGLAGALPAPAMLVALALCGAMLGFAPFNRRTWPSRRGANPAALLSRRRDPDIAAADTGRRAVLAGPSQPFLSTRNRSRFWRAANRHAGRYFASILPLWCLQR